ncbi:MAG: CoA pyrophosphatase, partial [Bacteroidetes bacterium]|nr:CoA pyrophosphatase [Bacteroidota bacterium]
MHTVLFSTWIRPRIQNPLPGTDAHGTIWSYPRNSFEDALQMDPPPRHSAVNLLLKEKAESLELGFIVRSDFGIHGGQVAFPGGKIQPGESYEQCANRETEEEIGIFPDNYIHLGALSPVFIPPSNMLVFPMLKLIHGQNPLTLDTREIEDFFWVEIGDLLPTKIIEKEHYLK